MEATPGSREEVGMVGRRWELAEARARSGGDNGGRQTAGLSRRSCADGAFIDEARARGEDLAAKQPGVFTRGTAALGVRARRAHGQRHGRARTRRVALGSPVEVASRSARTRRM
jgi:hypothetical protein